MKKPALLTAMMLLVAGTTAAQEVTTEVYGDFRYSYNRADAGEESHWAGANNASRLGIRGSVSESGLTAFADLQVGVGIDDPAAFEPRYFLAGLRGGFGSVVIGRHSPAYKMAGLRLDRFYDTSSLGIGGAVPYTGLFAGATFGLSPLTNGFADRAIAYSTPVAYGFSASAAAYIDPESDHDYGVGLSFIDSGFDVGVQFYDAEGADNWAFLAAAAGAEVDAAVRVHASFTRADSWSLGSSFERLESNLGERQDYLYAVGTVNLTSATVLAGSFGRVGDGGGIQPMTGHGFTGGIFHAIFPQARVHALYSFLNVDDGPARGNAAVGLTYSFLLRP